MKLENRCAHCSQHELIERLYEEVGSKVPGEAWTQTHQRVAEAKKTLDEARFGRRRMAIAWARYLLQFDGDEAPRAPERSA